MTARSRWSGAADLVGTAAVVISLVYVGLQVRQNTAAIQTSTSQDVYQQHQEFALLLMESRDMAEIVVNAGRDLHGMSAVDSLRYNYYLNLTFNRYEAVYTNTLNGTMDRDMAAGWLKDLGDVICKPGMSEFWARGKTWYHPAFQLAVDSASATARCPQ